MKHAARHRLRPGNGNLIEVPSKAMVAEQIKALVRKQAEGKTTEVENGLIHEQFVELAAAYNDIMERDYTQCIDFKCEPNWSCQCPAHLQLARESQHRLWRRLEVLDPGYREVAASGGAGEKQLQGKWWEKRGFRLIKTSPGSEIPYDLVVLPDGRCPVPKNILERAAQWWTEHIAATLIGKEVRPEHLQCFPEFTPRRYTRYTWTAKRKEALRDALLTEFLDTRRTVSKHRGQGVWLEIGSCRSWTSTSITDALEKLGLSLFDLSSDTVMIITTGSIKVNQTVWEA